MFYRQFKYLCFLLVVFISCSVLAQKSYSLKFMDNEIDRILSLKENEGFDEFNVGVVLDSQNKFATAVWFVYDDGFAADYRYYTLRDFLNAEIEFIYNLGKFDLLFSIANPLYFGNGEIELARSMTLQIVG